MAELPTVKRDANAYHFANMTASEFWKKTLSFKQNKQQKGAELRSDNFVYYASNVEALPSLLPDIDPVSPLMVTLKWGTRLLSALFSSTPQINKM
jgi:hypothetical protein